MNQRFNLSEAYDQRQPAGTNSARLEASHRGVVACSTFSRYSPTARTSFPQGTSTGIVTAMQTFQMVWSVLLLLALMPSLQRNQSLAGPDKVESSQSVPAAKQLAAVRGEITKITAPGKGMLLITIRPAKEFQEVTVLARENDLVGTAVARSGEPDLLGLLSGDTRDDETITAAELNVGDVVSVIYDPRLQNRTLEIYFH